MAFGNFFDEISSGLKHTVDDIKNHPVNSLLNFGSQYLSKGYLGVDASKGQFDWGVAEHGADESIGAVSGRNTARVAQTMEQEQIDAANAKFQTSESNRVLQNYRSDVMASRSAAAVRSTAQARSAGPGFVFPGSNAIMSQGGKLGSDQASLLGI